MRLKRYWRTHSPAARRRREARIRDYLGRHDVAKLHLGATRDEPAGWLNTGLSGRRRGVMHLNAARPFPLPSDAFHYVYSEHMIEHLSHTDAEAMLAECYRVCRPGGVIRIATPDLEVFVGLMARPTEGEARRFIDGEFERLFPEAKTADPIYLINSLFYSYEHRFIFDGVTLERFLREAGFTDVRRCGVSESEHEALKDIEQHGRNTGRHFENAFHTMVYEGTKPAE
jgi:predicted SAM-dependent methyltransferase